MPVAQKGDVKYAWQMQNDAELDQANPVSGTIYPILATNEDVRIISASIWVTWTVQPTPLELYLNIDGHLFTFTFANPATATTYYANNQAGQIHTALLLSVTDTIHRSFLYEGQSISVSGEITGGTVSRMQAIVRWAKLLPT